MAGPSSTAAAKEKWLNKGILGVGADSHPDHHARRRERRRRVKQLRQRPLGDLNVPPTFLTDALGPSSDVVTATAADLGPLLDGAGYKVQGQSASDDVAPRRRGWSGSIPARIHQRLPGCR
jgi:hypothetical protein